MDHVPPKEFFLPNQRTNLVTAPLCIECHEKLSENDNRMRSWLSCALYANEAGKWIARNRTRKSLDADDRMRREMAGNISPVKVVGLPRGAGTIKEEQWRVRAFIIRLTKAFLYKYAPAYDYFPDFFTIRQRTYHEEKAYLSTLQKHDGGNNVFEAWGGLMTDNHTGGIWAFRFYEAGLFICVHGKDVKYRQPIAPDSVPDGSLPKSLEPR